MANIVVIVTGIMVCLSCVVGMLFTKVPLVYGNSVSKTMTKLDEVGLEIAFEPGISRDENLETVVSGHSPEEGSLVLKGTSVVVYLNTVQKNNEPEKQGMVTVPKVVGMEQNEATELLVGSGLQFQVWWTEENNVVAEEYYIINQSIPEDSEVPPGTLVKLELSPNKP